jgi:hypothetical protein
MTINIHEWLAGKVTIGRLTRELKDSISEADWKILTDDNKRWKEMGAGQHLDQWLAYGPGHAIRRREAIRLTNNTKGQNYSLAMSMLGQLAGMDPSDKKLMRYLADALWLTENEDRMEILAEIRASMTPGERARLNAVDTARKRVKAILDERLTDPHERAKHGLAARQKEPKPSHPSKEERDQALRDEGAADARQDVERLEEEVERLERALRVDGGVVYADKTAREIAEEEFDRILQSTGSTGRAALTAVANITQALAEIAQERLDDFEDDEKGPDDDGPGGGPGVTGESDDVEEEDLEHAGPPEMPHEPEEPDDDEPEPTVHHRDGQPGDPQTERESIAEILDPERMEIARKHFEAEGEKAKAEKRAERGALQKEQNKKPKFTCKKLSNEERDKAIDRFHRLLATAAQPGSPAEGEKAEQAARQMVENGSIDPTARFLDYAGKRSVGGTGHYFDNLLLAKLRQEHRQQWRQSVSAENLQREEHDALLLRLTPEQHEALSKKWSGAWYMRSGSTKFTTVVIQRISDMKAALGETAETVS